LAVVNSPNSSRGGVLRARHIVSLIDGVRGDAVWWEDGAIRRVGRAVELDRDAPSFLPRYDLPNTLVTPGFVDGHTHFAM
jgi:imidazolonepropionase-like amidohydrolase